MTAPRFRISYATEDDITELTLLHRDAFAGSVGVRLGMKYINGFINWFIHNSSATVLVARKDDIIVGYVFGAPAGYASELNRALLGLISRALLTHPWVLLDYRLLRQLPVRLKSLFRMSERSVSPVSKSVLPPRIYRLTAIGVSSRYRGQGIGKSLMKAYEQHVWDKGFDQLQLSVYPTNFEAQKLYESCGWQAINSHRKLLVFAKLRTN